MNVEEVNFDVIEELIEQRLKDKNIHFTREDGCIKTGYDYLHLRRSEVQVAAIKGAKDKFVASVEINAQLRHSSIEKAIISDLVTAQADSPDNALRLCAHFYMHVTFPAIQALFDPAVAKSNKTISLASITQPGSRMVNWSVYTGVLQVGGDHHKEANEFLSKLPPIATVMNTITGYLTHATLHWCKLYAMVTGQGKLIVGCAIDNKKSTEGEKEMSQKLPDALKSLKQWEFRQFFVLLPGGEVAPELAQKLRLEDEKRVLRSKRWWQIWK